MFSRLSLTCLTLILLFASSTSASEFTRFEWTEENPAADWDPRAGLQAVEMDGSVFVLGGRTPVDPAEVPVFGASIIHGDVWRTDDLGLTWQQILATDTPGHWAPRAYFQSLMKDDLLYVIGGQDFTVIANPDTVGPPLIGVSQFFDDVWSSPDGVNWTERTSAAGWEGRAGLSAAVYDDAIWVLGGSVNDDDAIGGPGGPPRIYFNDVWKSTDNGETWDLVTASAPWEPRAGGIALAFNGYLYMIGGEAGFTCFPIPCDPPYFNDVWRTRDGIDWELMTADAEWSPRPGHQAVAMEKHLVLWGGFGMSQNPADPFAPSNPMDVWVSIDGASWQQVDDAPWNAASPADIRYDFDAVVVDQGPEGGPAILSFGGDRETFSPFDPFNWLNVDNDVYSYTLPARAWLGNSAGPADPLAVRVSPNPFNPATTIAFSNPVAQPVRLVVYDVAGRAVRTLVDGMLGAGDQRIRWNGTDDRANRVASGVYLFRVETGAASATGRLVLSK